MFENCYNFIMIFAIIQLLTLNIVIRCHGYIHLGSMKIFEHTAPINNSLFGYSMAYQTGIQRLVITAPQGNNIGQVFTMALNSSNIENVNMDSKLLPRNPQITHDFWLGATVRANSDFFVTCAPRYAEMKTNKKPKSKNPTKSPATLGLCILFDNNKSDTYETKRLTYMSNENRIIRPNHREIKFGDLQDSMGWSMDITKSGQVLIGSPAMMTGRVVFYENPFSKNYPKLIYKMNQENLARYYYGYSLTSGAFFDETSVYVISATFGYGKVYFFDTKYKNIGTIKDINIGSMFGAALCPARLDTNTLLVGAPTYSDKSYDYDVGAVYVYEDQTAKGSKQMLLKRKIQGTSRGSYFGHAIVSLGDIDGDQKDEIVIAAPFEDGNGAVYFYSGAGILDGTSPPRRIKPEGFRSFGFSLTVLEDTDENGCNELAVGSPKDEKFVILKSIASITVQLEDNLQQKSEEVYILESCIDGLYPLKPEIITADLMIVIKLRNAVFTTVISSDGVYQYEVSLKEKKKFCKNFDLRVLLDESSKSDKELILAYDITASLKEDPEQLSEFDPTRVLLSDESVLKSQGEKWKDDNSIQQPELILSISSSMTQPYMIGSSYQESFTLSVLNKGGAAHAPCMHVSVKGARVIGYPRSCKRGLDVIVCRRNQIMKTNDDWKNEIQIETDYLTSNHEILTISSDLYSQCGGKLTASENETIGLTPYNDMVVLKGQSNPDQIVPMTVDDLLKGKSFEHVYTIYNYGLTNWVGVQSEITLENLPFIDYTDTPIKVYTYTSLIECEIRNMSQDQGKVSVLCKIGDLGMQEKIIVVVAMKIAKNTLEFDSEDQNVTVTTSLNLLLRDGDKFLSLNTTLIFEAAKVPLWVTLASSFFGVFLIIIIAYILYDNGFLQRKTKEKLIVEKREYVRRSMMRNSSRAAVNRRGIDNDFSIQEVGNTQEEEF